MINCFVLFCFHKYFQLPSVCCGNFLQQNLKELAELANLTAEGCSSMIPLISKMNLILLLKGISKTIQRGDMGKYGQHFMIAPMTNEVVINQQTCFTLKGTEGDEVGPQHALPDVSKFEQEQLYCDIVTQFHGTWH